MERYARITGYSVALALLVGLLWLVSTLREGLLFPHNRIKVAFPTIGTLMEDDPVKLQGVQVGRVASIEKAGNQTIAVLDFFHRTPIPADSRFINYNYSLFGARMVILVQGDSKVGMDPRRIQQGDFSTGVSETIHKVEELLATVLEYRRLSSRLETGTDSTLSVQQFLGQKIYPVLEEFGNFTKDLEALENEAGTRLDQLNLASAQVNGLGRALSSQSDTLIVRANRTLARLAVLTARSTQVLKGLEEVIAASQDTTRGPGRLMMNRELYEHALSMTHALQDLLKVAKQEGLTDVIHFWKNVHIRWKKPKD
jgi:phospholipid/cholesterol/gamma-HCH transport system substrate-binding protein